MCSTSGISGLHFDVNTLPLDTYFPRLESLETGLLL